MYECTSSQVCVWNDLSSHEWGVGSATRRGLMKGAGKAGRNDDKDDDEDVEDENHNDQDDNNDEDSDILKWALTS